MRLWSLGDILEEEVHYEMVGNIMEAGREKDTWQEPDPAEVTIDNVYKTRGYGIIPFLELAFSWLTYY